MPRPPTDRVTVHPALPPLAVHPAGRAPCGVCLTCHQGRCTPAERRSVTMSVCLPQNLYTALTEAVPWGERSGWLADLIRKELGR